ncbi:MAG: PP2C family serine/threonine-protein phosphatase [Chloroflexota bacterium]
MQDETNQHWRVIGASVRGTSHVATDRACEDAHAYLELENGILLLAVADGAGSASRAREGSQEAVKAIIVTLGHSLHSSAPQSEAAWKTLLEAGLRETRVALEELAKAEETTPESSAEGDSFDIAAEKGYHPRKKPRKNLLREFATTLLVAVVTPEWLAVAQIGDGFVVSQQSDLTIHNLTIPEYGTYLNETFFLTQEDYLAHVQYAVVAKTEEVRGIALLTDGLELLAMDLANKVAHSPFFVPILEAATQTSFTQTDLETFLNSERVCSRTDDDKTLLLAVQHKYVK